MRKCASQLVMYETRNRMELDSLYNEVIVGLNKAEWYQLCKYVWGKKFQFSAPRAPLIPRVQWPIKARAPLGVDAGGGGSRPAVPPSYPPAL